MGNKGNCVGQSVCSYEETMEALSSLITRRTRGDGSNRVGKFGLMFKYVKVLGLEDDLPKLKVIHIAGTKGKGSTCTFSEAILRECGFRTGLFTSPHLIDVRERYRINGLDVSEEKFLEYFWDCWNQLKENVTEDLPMPTLFQFLSLLAFKIFISEKVDVAILEVGLGGKLDSTNVVKEPVVCGITSLGMDHMEILGDTLGKIASEKSGIFKPRVPAFTVPQLSEAMDVLQERASELMSSLEIALPLDPENLNGMKLGLAGDHQFINAGLAVALCRCWLQKTGHSKEFDTNGKLLPEAFLKGLSTAALPGRAQIVHDESVKSDKSSESEENTYGDLVFYLDGAHSPESMEACARWFSRAVSENKYANKGEKDGEFVRSEKIQYDCKDLDGSDKISKQILLFNCMEVRDPQQLLPQLFHTCASHGVHFSKAIFVPSISTYYKVDSGSSAIPIDTSKDVSWQATLQRTWERIIHGKDAISNGSLKTENSFKLPSNGFAHGKFSQKCNFEEKQFNCSAIIPSLPLTIKWLRDCAKENPSIRVQVLVTGSLHLVGDVLKLLRR
ncbi:Folylpolyglutamate synthase [Acorus calamus]|uniref:Folylpolyglutamate synthase n=1 Tax=Acorus calamus TaxID=4465 RepID=A0AAV9ETT9_ACOCL|nr:Folylpolyglutamate synthase [Acorus calamus]